MNLCKIAEARISEWSKERMLKINLRKKRIIFDGCFGRGELRQRKQAGEILCSAR
jgi:hypothetical protein